MLNDFFFAEKSEPAEMQGEICFDDMNGVPTKRNVFLWF